MLLFRSVASSCKMLSDPSFPRPRTSWVLTMYRHARYYTGVRPQIILLIFNCFFTCSDQQLRPVTEKVQRSNADPAGAAETHLLLEILADLEDVGQHCLWLPLASQLKLTVVGNIHLLAYRTASIWHQSKGWEQSATIPSSTLSGGPSTSSFRGTFLSNLLTVKKSQKNQYLTLKTSYKPNPEVNFSSVHRSIILISNKQLSKLQAAAACDVTTVLYMDVPMSPAGVGEISLPVSLHISRAFVTSGITTGGRWSDSFILQQSRLFLVVLLLSLFSYLQAVEVSTQSNSPFSNSLRAL